MNAVKGTTVESPIRQAWYDVNGFSQTVIFDFHISLYNVVVINRHAFKETVA